MTTKTADTNDAKGIQVGRCSAVQCSAVSQLQSWVIITLNSFSISVVLALAIHTLLKVHCTALHCTVLHCTKGGAAGGVYGEE